MTTLAKRLAWALVTTALVLVATAVVISHVYGVPPSIAFLLRRPITEPTAQEYAAYSAFVDDFFSSSNQPFRPDLSLGQDGVVHIADETLQMRNPGSILPLDVVALGPNEMGEDFYRQNTHTWRLQPRFRTRLRVSIVDAAMVHGVSSVLRLSRAGFDRGGTLALLYYVYRCGSLCGQSGWAALRRGPNGWHIEQLGTGFVY